MREDHKCGKRHTMKEKYLQANMHVALKMLKFITEAKSITHDKIWLLYYIYQAK